MRTALQVGDLTVLTLKPFGTFNAVELSETWEILCCLCSLVLFQVLW